jgi:hypothetical protein
MEACGGSHFLGRALREQGHAPPCSRRVRPEARFLAVSSSRSLRSSADVITELSATSGPRFQRAQKHQCRFRAIGCRHLQHLYLRSEPCSLRHCLGEAQTPAFQALRKIASGFAHDPGNGVLPCALRLFNEGPVEFHHSILREINYRYASALQFCYKRG